MPQAFKGRKGHPRNVSVGDHFDDWESLRRSGTHLSMLPIHEYGAEIYSIVIDDLGDDDIVLESSVVTSFVHEDDVEDSDESLTHAIDILQIYDGAEWPVRLIQQLPYNGGFVYRGMYIVTESWDQLNDDGQRVGVFTLVDVNAFLDEDGREFRAEDGGAQIWSFPELTSEQIWSGLAPSVSEQQMSSTFRAGHVEGVQLGTRFGSRQALRQAHIHSPLSKRIHDEGQAVFSIIVRNQGAEDRIGRRRIEATLSDVHDPGVHQHERRKAGLGALALADCARSSTSVRVVLELADGLGFEYLGTYTVDEVRFDPAVTSTVPSRVVMTADVNAVPQADRWPAESEQPAEPIAGQPSPPPPRPADRVPPPPPPPPPAPTLIQVPHAPTEPAQIQGLDQDWIIELFVARLVAAGSSASSSTGELHRALCWLHRNGGSASAGEVARALDLPDSDAARIAEDLRSSAAVSGTQLVSYVGGQVYFHESQAREVLSEC